MNYQAYIFDLVPYGGPAGSTVVVIPKLRFS